MRAEKKSVCLHSSIDSRVRIEKDYDLTAVNTFRMRARCACYVEYDSVAELESLDWDSLPGPVRHIGGGSNILFTADFPGTILHSAIRFVKYVDMGFDEVPVMVGAGTSWDSFVEETCGHGLWGAENLSLIPGEVGAAAVQNIGAYGVEVKDIISGIVCFDTVERRKLKFPVGECAYGYRDSLFKQSGGRFVVTSVLFRLSRVPRPVLNYKGLSELAPSSPMDVRNAVVAIRREKLPDPAVLGSAGSFFKNPVISREQYSALLRRTGGEIPPHFDFPNGDAKITAAWLIERCGFKGVAEGGAAVYEKQPLVIVNASGEASAQDVLRLEAGIIDAVQERFGITLHPEVEHF